MAKLRPVRNEICGLLGINTPTIIKVRAIPQCSLIFMLPFICLNYPQWNWELRTEQQRQTIQLSSIRLSWFNAI